MGGWNSGRWGGVRTKQTTAQCLRIDLARLCSNRRVITLLSANLGERPLHVRLEPNLPGKKVSISATVPEGSSGWQVRLIETRPQFGGVRYWFSCPRCGHRRRVLRITFTPRLGCHGCLDLAYPTQRMDRYWRLNRRLDRVWKDLGGTEESQGRRYWPKRPKWRRRATQYLLRDRWEWLNAEIWSVGSAELARMFKLM